MFLDPHHLAAYSPDQMFWIRITSRPSPDQMFWIRITWLVVTLSLRSVLHPVAKEQKVQS